MASGTRFGRAVAGGVADFVSFAVVDDFAGVADFVGVVGVADFAGALGLGERVAAFLEAGRVFAAADLDERADLAGVAARGDFGAAALAAFAGWRRFAGAVVLLAGVAGAGEGVAVFAGVLTVVGRVGSV